MNDFLTVGIPAWNDASSLDESVNKITKSTAWIERSNSEKELIICVNGVKNTQDKTAKKAIELSKKIPGVRVLILKEKGKNLALNNITRRSNPKSKFIFFCDSDVLVKRTTISKVLDALISNPRYKIAAPAAMPATNVVPEKNRSSLKAFYLARAKLRLKKEDHFISGASWAVEKLFLLRNPLPETNNIADDLYVNTKFKRKIFLVRNARVYFLTPGVKDRIYQRARYIVQEKEQHVQKPKAKSNKDEGNTYSKKEKFGKIIYRTTDYLARGLVRIHPKIGWKNLKSTKLNKKRH